jgi:site-specific recombinase
MNRLGWVFFLTITFAWSWHGQAGEADDLQRAIESGRQTANDLERRDDQKAVSKDLQVLRMWLDQAWSLRSQEKFDEARVILDACRAQGDLIREKITTAKLKAQVDQKEAELARKRATLERIKKALEDAKLQASRLEGGV